MCLWGPGSSSPPSERNGGWSRTGRGLTPPYFGPPILNLEDRFVKASFLRRVTTRAFQALGVGRRHGVGTRQLPAGVGLAAPKACPRAARPRSVQLAAVHQEGSPPLSNPSAGPAPYGQRLGERCESALFDPPTTRFHVGA
jgi:hypothetical protein